MDIQLVNVWLNLALAVITFLAVIVALFGQRFWEWINKPNIKVGISNESHYVVQGIRESSIIFYFRMKVVNTGKTVARNCRVKLISVVPENKEVKFYWEPDNLKWSSAPRDMRYRHDPERDIGSLDKNQLTPIFKELKDIPPNNGWEFCDLFDICNGFVRFASYGNRQTLPYHEGAVITLEIFGDNIKPKQVKFKLSQSGDFRQVKINRILR